MSNFLFDTVKESGWDDSVAHGVFYGKKGHILDQLVHEGSACLSANPQRALEDKVVVMAIIKNGQALWSDTTETVTVQEIMSQEEEDEYMEKKAARLFYYEIEDLQEFYGLDNKESTPAGEEIY